MIRYVKGYGLQDWETCASNPVQLFANYVHTLGQKGDIPIARDFTKTGHLRFAVYRNGNFLTLSLWTLLINQINSSQFQVYGLFLESSMISSSSASPKTSLFKVIMLMFPVKVSLFSVPLKGSGISRS